MHFMILQMETATATITKNRTDKINNIVFNYGNTWRFSFNAKKSAVLVNGESSRENFKNSAHRIFKMGPDPIPERQEYDHVGIEATIDPENENRLQERIGENRRALNAATGLGIRKNGLTMKTCNVIFGR